MTKKEASQLYHLNREAEMWQRALAAERSKSLIQGQQLTGMPTRGMVCSDKLSNKAIKELEIEEKIKELEYKVAEEKAKILAYIQNLDNSVDRQIVWLRTACCLTWRTIAKKIGGNNTADSVRIRYNRLFKNF